MSLIAPADQATLAAAVADTLVVACDPEARKASISFWERGRPYREAVLDAAEQVEDPAIREAAAALMAVPADPVAYRTLRAHLEAISGPDKTKAIEALFDQAWRVECNSRIGYQLGPDYAESGEVVGVRDLWTLPPRGENNGLSNSEVLIVVPFRDRGSETRRLRNLLACLLALRDQSVSRDSYQVVTVETDDEPRWQEAIEPYADHYLFARKPGAFNKSWAVNVGVVNTPGRPEVICILDADVLPDRDFVARNAADDVAPGA